MTILEMLNNDEIRVVPEFPEYFASRKGDVYSARNGKIKLLGSKHHKSNYIHLTLKRGKVTVTTTAHRVVWETFNGPIPEGMVVDHINAKKTDNRLSNLRVATYSENLVYRKCKNYSYHKGSNSWVVVFQINKVRTYGGSYKTEKEAKQAVKNLRPQIYGQFSWGENV